MVDRQISLFDTVGDFLVNESATDAATEEFSERSQRSQRQDRSQRARVTTDYSKWEENPDEWDFPGVDTPTAAPRALPKDLKAMDKPRTTDTDTPDGRTLLDPIGSEQRGRQEVEAGLAAQDVSLSPDEALRGVGAVGMAESDPYPNIPVQDEFARYDLDPMEEQEDIDSIVGMGRRGESAQEQLETEKTVQAFNEGNIGLRELGTRLME